MDKSQENTVKELIREFVGHISQHNVSALSSEFGISDAVLKEIAETLKGYGISISQLEAPDFERSRVIDIFQMDDPKALGVEVNLWAKGKCQEPILHAEVSFAATQPAFQFQYIGS